MAKKRPTSRRPTSTSSRQAPAPAKAPTKATASAASATRTTKAQQASAAAAGRRSRNRRLTVIAAIVAFVVALVVVVVVASNHSSKKTATPATPGTTDPAVTCTADTKTDPGANHVSNPTYTVNPPAGGDHLPVPAAPGIYDVGNVPADGNIVHSMEHGYIVIWQRPDISNATRTKTEAEYKKHPNDILLVERPSLPTSTPVVATAWHNRLLCTGADPAQLEAFFQQFNNQGPELIPHNVPPAGRAPRT